MSQTLPPPPPLPPATAAQYCDLGNLRNAAARGLLHRRLGPEPGAPIGVDLPALLGAALAVAEALAYLHSIRLVHCDVKLDNVLLKTDVAQPCGYIAKLSDFGLTKVLGASDAAVNVHCTGTVSHLAPEMFTPGSRMTSAVDAFAFGVLLYELYMGGAHAYAGLSKQAVIERVARAGMRPGFPPGAPPAYAALAAACWSSDPERRPSFEAIIAALHDMLAAPEHQPARPRCSRRRRGSSLAARRRSGAGHAPQARANAYAPHFSDTAAAAAAVAAAAAAAAAGAHVVAAERGRRRRHVAAAATRLGHGRRRPRLCHPPAAAARGQVLSSTPGTLAANSSARARGRMLAAAARWRMRWGLKRPFGRARAYAAVARPRLRSAVLMLCICSAPLRAAGDRPHQEGRLPPPPWLIKHGNSPPLIGSVFGPLVCA